MAHIQRFDVIENLQNDLAGILGGLDAPANQLEWAAALASSINNINLQLKEVLESMIEMNNYFVDEMAAAAASAQPAETVLPHQPSLEQTMVAVEVTEATNATTVPAEDHGAKVIEVTIE